MFSAARDFSPIEHNVCVTYFVIFVYIYPLTCVHSCSYDKSLIVLHFPPHPLSIIVTLPPATRPRPTHHTHWHFVYHDLLPAVHDYVIILCFLCDIFCTVCLVFNYIVYVCE